MRVEARVGMVRQAWAKLTIVACLLAIAICALAPTASAAVAEPFWSSPEDGIDGENAGQIHEPRGVAVDPVDGHVFLADSINGRIAEFDGWGQFVKAWGYGVVRGGAAGSGELSAGSKEVTSVTVTAKAFEVGQALTGTGIPADTQITDVGVGTLTLSNPATASGSDVAITSAEGAGNVPVNERQVVTLGGSPSGGSFTLTFAGGETAGDIVAGSNQITNTRRCCYTNFGGAFHVGDTIGYPSRPGSKDFPGGTTIAAVDSATGTVTVSNPATTTRGQNFSALETTGPIPFGAPASGAGSVQSALEALPAIGPGNVTVTGPDAGPYVVEFKGPLLADTNVDQMTASGSALTPAGTASVTTAQDGGGAVEVCVAGEPCRAGFVGAAAGEFDFGTGLAIDSGGDLYAVDRGNGRVQKFDSAGHFLLAFGGEVDKTTVREREEQEENAEPVTVTEAEENLCTAASGDECGGGTEGGGQGQFSQWSFGHFIAPSPDGETIYVGDFERIEEFDTAGHYLGEIPLPGLNPYSLAVDPVSGDFYATFAKAGGFGGNPDVFRLDSASGEVLATLKVPHPGPIATGANGDLYVWEEESNNGIGGGGAIYFGNEVLRFDSSGSPVESLNFPRKIPGESKETHTRGIAVSSACGIEGAEVVGGFSLTIGLEGGKKSTTTALEAYGPPPQDTEAPCPEPPERAPTITEAYATSVGTDAATLRAKINPHFWRDTRYYVEYGTGKCTEGGCDKTQPAPPGSLLSERVVNSALPTAGVLLTGLSPGTVYHYRFIAESAGGGPVYREGALRTFPASFKANTDCPNQAFRNGSSAALPDCRAFEMVSPVDKGGGDILTRVNVGSHDSTALDQVSPDGGKLAYSSYASFGDAESTPYTTQYIAERGGDGWASHAISPPRGFNIFWGEPGLSAINQFKAFSADLCEGWLLDETEQALAPGAVSRFANIYRRRNCEPGAGTYTALSTVEPPHLEPGGFVPLVQGVSADGSHALFTAHDKLTADAPDLGAYIALLYLTNGSGEAVFVCMLPDGSPAGAGCSAGTGTQDPYGHNETVAGAISADGSRVFWSDRPAEVGAIYARENPEQPESAHLHGVAAGTGNLIGPAKGFGKTTFGKETVTKVELESGGFAPGQEITDSNGGIPAGTKVAKVEEVSEGVFTLTLDAAATKTKSEVELTGTASKEVLEASAASGAFAPGQQISGPGVPDGATVLAVAEGTLTLSAPATKTIEAAPLSATSECTEAAKACTVAVSGGAPARFWAAAADGSVAIYTVGTSLYEFDLEAGEAHQIGTAAGVLGASADARRVYFISDGGLYLHEAGAGSTYLAPGGGVSGNPSPIAAAANEHSAEVSADGRHLVFTSTASLTGYDNADVSEGKAAAEVYIYDAENSTLSCASCNPTGARPHARVVPLRTLWAAATIPTTNTDLYLTPRVLAEDGSRLFFESFDALLPHRHQRRRRRL